MIMVLVRGSQSDMQDAEESMAADCGVRVIKVRFEHGDWLKPNVVSPTLKALAAALAAPPEPAGEARLVLPVQQVLV